MAYDITFALDLFNRNVDPEESLVALQTLVVALTAIDVEYLRRHPNTPSLYLSRVRYVPEPAGSEKWQDIPTTLKRMQGDCEDLACWRAAEMFVREGVQARAKALVSRVFPDGKRLYHIVVELPDGNVEDPSTMLGMGLRNPSSTSLVSR